MNAAKTKCKFLFMYKLAIESFHLFWNFFNRMVVCLGNQKSNFDIQRYRFECYGLFVDIDECQTSNPCNAGGTCINTHRSFICICPAGFENETGVCEGENSIYIISFTVQ